MKGKDFHTNTYIGYVGLLLSGAALFLNSLVILGKAEMKSAGVLIYLWVHYKLLFRSI